MPPDIEIIEIAEGDVRALNVSPLVRAFTQIGANAVNATRKRGRIFLSFPAFESDPRPTYEVPEVRQFVQALDAALPHFPYFLVGDPAIGHQFMYSMCLVPQADVETRTWGVPLLHVVDRKIAAVAAFCATIADDAARATDPLLMNLPAAMAKNDPALAARILAKLRVTLVGLETGLRSGPADDAQRDPHAREVIANALVLAGLDGSSYKTDGEALRALIAHITPPVSRAELDRFNARFDETLTREPGQKLKADMAAVRRLVAAERNAAYQFVAVHVRMAASQPGYLQTAAVVATAIHDELGDRSALLQIERRAEELDADPATWQPSPA